MCHGKKLGDLKIPWHQVAKTSNIPSRVVNIAGHFETTLGQHFEQGGRIAETCWCLEGVKRINTQGPLSSFYPRNQFHPYAGSGMFRQQTLESAFDDVDLNGTRKLALSGQKKTLGIFRDLA